MKKIFLYFILFTLLIAFIIYITYRLYELLSLEIIIVIVFFFTLVFVMNKIADLNRNKREKKEKELGKIVKPGFLEKYIYRCYAITTNKKLCSNKGKKFFCDSHKIVKYVMVVSVISFLGAYSSIYAVRVLSKKTENKILSTIVNSKKEIIKKIVQNESNSDESKNPETHITIQFPFSNVSYSISQEKSKRSSNQKGIKIPEKKNNDKYNTQKNISDFVSEKQLPNSSDLYEVIISASPEEYTTFFIDNNDQKKYTVPITLKLTIGEHKFTFSRKGYKTKSIYFEVYKNKTGTPLTIFENLEREDINTKNDK